MMGDDLLNAIRARQAFSCTPSNKSLMALLHEVINSSTECCETSASDGNGIWSTFGC